ncbi:MAG: PIN domain-containing protein [Terrimicrobiaceae bacterium]
MTLTRQNWVLVDYENVQNIDLDLVANLPVHVILFIGQQQKSVPVALLTKALVMKEQVTVMVSAGVGKNAMDFQMAFHAGRITEADPEAYVHFVSKDKGFDVLVKHMKSRKLFADQAAAFASLKFLTAKEDGKVVPDAERAEYVVERLRKQSPASRPRKKRTLLSSVASMFGKKLAAGEVESVVKQLIAGGEVAVGQSDGVTYSL